MWKIHVPDKRVFHKFRNARSTTQLKFFIVIIRIFSWLLFLTARFISLGPSFLIFKNIEAPVSNIEDQEGHREDDSGVFVNNIHILDARQYGLYGRRAFFELTK